MFVVNTQQCFAYTPQAKFPAHNLNFHWRWRGDGIISRLDFKIFSTLQSLLKSDCHHLPFIKYSESCVSEKIKFIWHLPDIYINLNAVFEIIEAYDCQLIWFPKMYTLYTNHNNNYNLCLHHVQIVQWPCDILPTLHLIKGYKRLQEHWPYILTKWQTDCT